MGRTDFNPEWYGAQAKVLTSNEDQMVVDYGCNGRGIVKSYKLFDGIQLCFLDFETDESMKAQKFNPDIIQVTHCQTGRYECEFTNHTVAYLPKGYFSIAATAYLPASFSFPLGKYYGVSLVIDRQALSEETRRIMQTIPINLDKIGATLGLETRWYVSECLALRVEDISLPAREIKVRHGKGNKMRVVYFGDKVVNAVREYLRNRPKTENPYLFPGRGDSHLTRSQVNRIFNEHSESITPHTLRHFFCSNALENGYTIADLANQAGHSNVHTTLLYTNPTREKMKEKANRL